MLARRRRRGSRCRRLVSGEDPEGCAKSDVAVELPVRVHGWVWWHAAAPAGEAILMLSKPAYLTLCRSIQLLVLRPAVTPLRTWRSSSRATSSWSSAARPHDPSWSPPIGRCSPRSAASCHGLAGRASSLDRRRCCAGTGGLSPVPGLPAPPDRPASAEPGVQQLIVRLARENSTWATSASRESCSAWGFGSRQPRSERRCAATGWTSTAADGHHVAGVPAPAGRRDRGLRVLHRRQHLAATAVSAVVHRTPHATSAAGRRDCRPGRRLGHPAGPQPVAGAGERGRQLRFVLHDRDAKSCRGLGDVFGSASIHRSGVDSWVATNVKRAL